MNSQEEDDVRPEIAFLNEFCNYFGTKTNLDESLKQILVIKNKPETTKLEKTLLQLILDLNPMTKTYQSLTNQTLILKLIQYLINIKKKKEKANPLEIFNVFAEVFSDDPLYIKLFEKDDDLNDIKESYLEMIIPFVPDTQISLIINVMKNYTNEEELKFVEKILNDINLKIEESFLFLKKIIIGVINSKENLKQQIQDIKDNFLNNEKNELFRCNKCYSFPILYTDGNEPNKTIKIKHACNHFEGNVILESEQIRNTKPKCYHCDKVLSIINYNYLCSNCKNLVCNYCKQIHFIKCLTLFFIPFSEVGLICSEHNKKYEIFCSICQKNLCSLCKQEHEHFSNYSKTSLGFIDKTKIEDYVNKNNNINKAYKNLLHLIISDIKYLDNLQFHYFLDNLLEQKKPLDCGFFETFGNELFDKYYSTLINEYTKSSAYYRKIYQKIKDAYQDNNIKINNHEYDFDSFIIRRENDSKTHFRNSLQTSLLFDYFNSLNEVKNKIKEEKNKSDEGILKIKQEKSKIKTNPFSINSNAYKVNTIKLFNRYIANGILKYLITNYQNNFQKVACNRNIYDYIIKNFPKDNDLVINFKKENKNNIIDMTENNRDIKFIKSITIENMTISVDDLNILLEYLFYIKELGNDIPEQNTFDYKGKANKDDDKKNYNKNNINTFNKNLLYILQNYDFKNKISNKCLLECLFEKKYENLLSEIKLVEVGENKEIVELDKQSELQNEINEEFKNLDESLDYFKSLHSSFPKYNDKKIKKFDSLSKFFERLYDASINKQSAVKLLINLNNLEYENCLLDNIPEFISECFNHIMSHLLQINESTINQLEKEIKKLKIMRNNNRVILETYKILNEKTTEIEGQFKNNNQDTFLKGLIDYLNKQKNEEVKFDYSQGSQILNSIKNNLEILLISNVDWLKNEEINISSLLCLYQSQSKTQL